jgi:YHS domain-containing protein
MSKQLITTLSAAVALMFACAAFSADDKEKSKYEPKCPVSGKEASKDHALKYKGGQLYFCCDNCPKAFEKDRAKYSVKANEQLVGTGQAHEVKCPLTGKPLNKETAIDIDGVKVCFCCNNCKGKVESAEGDKKAELVFSDAAFAKGFKVGDKEKKKKEKKDKT